MSPSEKVVFINPDLSAVECPPELAATITAEGWSVVNAPRPLNGEACWQGPFRSGIFYAAGPAERYEEHWRAYDAWPVVPLTNAAIRGLLLVHAREADVSLAEVLEFTTWAELARSYGYPWKEQP